MPGTNPVQYLSLKMARQSCLKMAKRRCEKTNACSIRDKSGTEFPHQQELGACCRGVEDGHSGWGSIDPWLESFNLRCVLMLIARKILTAIMI